MNREEIIGLLASGPKKIRQILSEVRSDQLDFRPSRPGAWTIREHVIHLVDSEVNNFIRVKSVIGQPGSDVYVIDEEAWTKNYKGITESVEDYLNLFELLRKIEVNLATVCSPAQFDGPTFRRTYQGATKDFTMKESLLMYAKHVDAHIEFIKTIISESGK